MLLKKSIWINIEHIFRSSYFWQYYWLLVWRIIFSFIFVSAFTGLPRDKQHLLTFSTFILFFASDEWSFLDLLELFLQFLIDLFFHNFFAFKISHHVEKLIFCFLELLMRYFCQVRRINNFIWYLLIVLRRRWVWLS